MTHTVVGIFDDRGDAQAAMNELVAQGFIKENIDLSNRAATDTTTGSGSQSTASGNEGIGDRISNFFNSLFDDDEATARNYTYAAADAEAILTVQVDSDERARTAQEILDSNGSIDVEERGAQYGQQNYQSGTGAGTRAGINTGTDTGTSADMNDRRTIPVMEERLNVGKQEVERGGARIRSRIIEKPVEETIRLREEHVVVNRRPVDREYTDADLKNFQPGEMEITEHAEVPVVGKQARVVEEIEIGKNVTEREETVRDTVRSTDVNVEEFDRDTKTHTKSRGAKP